MDKLDINQLDFSRISILNRLNPASSNIPPNSTQKEYLRRHSADVSILIRIASLYILERATLITFSENEISTLAAYTDMTVDSTNRLTLTEFAQFELLAEKLGVTFDLTPYRRKLFGIPFAVHNLPAGTIQVEFGTTLATSICPKNIEDVDSILQEGRTTDCFVLALFYFMDQRVLLDQDRSRGQSFPRFLRVYSSHAMNNLIFKYFTSFLSAFRWLELAGKPADEITLLDIAHKMAEKK